MARNPVCLRLYSFKKKMSQFHDRCLFVVQLQSLHEISLRKLLLSQFFTILTTTKPANNIYFLTSFEIGFSTLRKKNFTK